MSSERFSHVPFDRRCTADTRWLPQTPRASSRGAPLLSLLLPPPPPLQQEEEEEKKKVRKTKVMKLIFPEPSAAALCSLRTCCPVVVVQQSRSQHSETTTHNTLQSTLNEQSSAQSYKGTDRRPTDRRPTDLRDTRPQNRAWKMRTRGRQHATRTRKSLSISRLLQQDHATATLLLVTDQ